MTWQSGEYFEGVNTEQLARDRDEDRALSVRSERKTPPRCYSGEAPHTWQDFGGATGSPSKIECGPCGISYERWQREQR